MQLSSSFLSFPTPLSLKMRAVARPHLVRGNRSLIILYQMWSDIHDLKFDLIDSLSFSSVLVTAVSSDPCDLMAIAKTSLRVSRSTPGTLDIAILQLFIMLFLIAVSSFAVFILLLLNASLSFCN